MKTNSGRRSKRSHLIRYSLALALVSSLAGLDCGTAFAAVTIDFSIIPDGTFVSANNPYGGILELQAQEGLRWVGEPIWRESSIRNGTLAVVPDLAPPDGALMWDYRSELIAIFLQPVVGLSFDAYCYRNAGYSYSGFDRNGVPFSGGGIIQGVVDGNPPPPPTLWVTFTPSIPDGGYLTGFSIGNGDPKYLDAAFWVDNIAFTQVPEPSSLFVVTSSVFVFGLLRIRLVRSRKQAA